MAKVTVYDGQFEKSLKRFKKKVLAEGIIQEIRDRQHFMKPSEKRNRAKAAAKMRHKKKQREENPALNEKRLY